jgi:hypothetical protein
LPVDKMANGGVLEADRLAEREAIRTACRVSRRPSVGIDIDPPVAVPSQVKQTALAPDRLTTQNMKGISFLVECLYAG